MSTDLNKHISMLGYKGTDMVTGFTGVITSISFDLYGCVQAVITPPINSDGETKSGSWYDVTRIELTGDARVMEVPNYSFGYIAQGKKGCAEKPAQ